MKPMFYVIRFEPELDLGDIDCYLKEIESPIRLEVGDKIALDFASFDRSIEDDSSNIVKMVKVLLEKSIYASTRYSVYFEISDIAYHHSYYDGEEINFHGIITLKGKQNESNRDKNANS